MKVRLRLFGLRLFGARIFGLILILSGCAGKRETLEPDQYLETEPLLAKTNLNYHEVAERFVTELTPKDNLDSPAAWADKFGNYWLIASAKDTDILVVYEAETGALIRRFGGPGKKLDQLSRPNGLAVIQDFLFVVERDNHRVQVFRLPELKSVGVFGADDLRIPYGLWVRSLGHDQFELIVSDAYMGESDEVPVLNELASRMKRYQISIENNELSANLMQTFGATTENGAIRIPESIWGDEVNNRLLIAEENVATGTGLRVYDLAGNFLEQNLGVGKFAAQAEGIALWGCNDGSGYWITTDQFKDRTAHYIWDRQSLNYLGAFAGKVTANTDGVALRQSSSPRFPDGVFFAVHDDQAVSAYDWRDIANALRLRPRCD